MKRSSIKKPHMTMTTRSGLNSTKGSERPSVTSRAEDQKEAREYSPPRSKKRTYAEFEESRPLSAEELAQRRLSSKRKKLEPVSPQVKAMLEEMLGRTTPQFGKKADEAPSPTPIQEIQELKKEHPHEVESEQENVPQKEVAAELQASQVEEAPKSLESSASALEEGIPLIAAMETLQIDQ